MAMTDPTLKVLQIQNGIREKPQAVSIWICLPIEYAETNLPDAGRAFQFPARFLGATE